MHSCVLLLCPQYLPVVQVQEDKPVVQVQNEVKWRSWNQLVAVTGIMMPTVAVVK